MGVVRIDVGAKGIRLPPALKHGRGLPVPFVSFDYATLGKQSFDHPHHLTWPYLQPLCRLQMMLDHLLRHPR
ncbi:UNVERIFIED_CONTAM: hypothetical protein Sradi_5106300 [Sesamum radiatum]|uniref:Uncharacterized protein n=1 Tax=Sesamum radiatum TaxID=300843 RepID=A0AAW2M1N3_SESRA